MRVRKIAASILAVTAMTGAQAATVLSEGFDNIASLTASGWVMTNNSAPVGDPWFQGNSGAFASQGGAAGSYIASSFLTTSAEQGVVDNWLISPELTIGAGTVLSFYTRTADAGFADALKVYFNAGSSSATASFTSLLLTVGDASHPYNTTGWTQYTLTLPTAVTGRVAFEYTVPNAITADYIGIDSVTVTAVPEPASLALLGLGLAVVGATVRRRRSAN